MRIGIEDSDCEAAATPAAKAYHPQTGEEALLTQKEIDVKGFVLKCEFCSKSVSSIRRGVLDRIRTQSSGRKQSTLQKGNLKNTYRIYCSWRCCEIAIDRKLRERQQYVRISERDREFYKGDYLNVKGSL
jgi:hypothetical protein